MTERKPWDHGGKSTKARGYGRQHQKLREQLFKQEPLCRMCKAKGITKPAAIADHIIRIADGGPVHDISNLQPLCKECHDRKSLIEQGKRPKRRISPDGWPIDD